MGFGLGVASVTVGRTGCVGTTVGMTMSSDSSANGVGSPTCGAKTVGAGAGDGGGALDVPVATGGASIGRGAFGAKRQLPGALVCSRSVPPCLHLGHDQYVSTECVIVKIQKGLSDDTQRA